MRCVPVAIGENVFTKSSAHHQLLQTSVINKCDEESNEIGNEGNKNETNNEGEQDNQIDSDTKKQKQQTNDAT